MCYARGSLESRGDIPTVSEIVKMYLSGGLFLAGLLPCLAVSGPVIGVMTQPTEQDPQLGNTYGGRSYLAASYVVGHKCAQNMSLTLTSKKYLESGGARVIPVHYDASKENLTATFHQINGLLFPGGAASLHATSAYCQATNFLYQLSMQENNNGGYFPIWVSIIESGA